MNGLLKDVMHDRADSLDAPQLDVAAIIRDGEQRRSRRFQAVAGGLVAASLVVGAAVAIPQLRAGEDRDRDTAGAVHSYDVAYSVGTTIHDGPRTVDAGVGIDALVQGISGYVVADGGGRVHAVVDGDTTQVGRLAKAHRTQIVSDDDVVAWVDAAAGGTLSVLDLATGERADVPLDAWPGEALVVEPGATGEGLAGIAAVDGRTVYVTDTRGVMAWDALDGDEPVLIPASDGMQLEVRDVQDGRILSVATSFEPEERDGSTTMVGVRKQRVGSDLEDGQAVPGTDGTLSPDGRYLATVELETREDAPSVATTIVGEVDGDVWTPVTSTAHESISVNHWLDADTFTATGWTVTGRSVRLDLLSCEVSTHSCTVVRTGDNRLIVLPSGHVSR